MIRRVWRRLRHHCVSCGHPFDQHTWKPFAGRPCRVCDCANWEH